MIEVRFTILTADGFLDYIIMPCENETLALQIAASGLLNVEWIQATFTLWNVDFVLSKEDVA